MLTPPQIRRWIQTSLGASGFRDLDTVPLKIWKTIVLHGKPALPPGFFGILFERLAHRGSGVRVTAQPFPLEEEIISRVFNSQGFQHLEGVFILHGGKTDEEFVSGLFFQIIDRLPGFFHPGIQFSNRDLETSLQEFTTVDMGFPARQFLEAVYKESLDAIVRTPVALGHSDLFEISHPNLFAKPADRTFYRVMMRGVLGVATWLRGGFTLREETPMVIAHFGEPQVLSLGGYDSLVNKGDISSLVPSELGFIDETMEVDLFDYKYLENQLLYFQREQGAVFRIRRDVFVQIQMTPFFEHERHLGLVFAWLLLLAEKIVETFTKDIVRIDYEFSGYQPSALEDACEFFRHFLREKGNEERVSIRVTKDRTRVVQASGRSQAWILGPSPAKGFKHVTLEFPQTDEFAGFEVHEQERVLGELINLTITRMVERADR